MSAVAYNKPLHTELVLSFKADLPRPATVLLLFGFAFAFEMLFVINLCAF